MPPPQVSRALAVIHTSMYDAWAVHDSKAIPVHGQSAWRRADGERTQANKERAISHAALVAASDLFPSESTRFAALMRELGFDPTDVNRELSNAAGIGNRSADAVLEFRHQDGSNQLGDLNPGPYSDYTGYKPRNDPGNLTDPSLWQPLRLPNGRVQSWLVPQWGLVKPFGLTSGSQFRPGPPPKFDSELYEQRAREVLRMSEELTDREKCIAEYWSDGPGSESPPGHWVLLATAFSREKDYTLDQNVKLFFALSNALMDAGIAAWDTKITYDSVRPITAIRHLFRNERVQAWAGPGRGTLFVNGSEWMPFQAASFITPPFAEYVSGHSTFSAASAEILKQFSGSDLFGLSHTIRAGTSPIEPNLVPAADVTLKWATFSDAADQAGRSRLYGGIHFEEGDIRGRILGRQVGVMVWQKAQSLWEGAAR